MFSNKKNKKVNGTSQEKDDTKKATPPLKPFSSKGKHVPNKPPIAPSFQPDVGRRAADVNASGPLRADRAIGGARNNRMLVVGRDIRLKGEITSCEKLIIEGHVEISLPEANNIEIEPTGFFKGVAEVKEADISGHFEGTLTAHQKLVVRSTGRISGTIRYGKIVIESGGEISGDMKTIGDPDSSEQN